MATLSEIVSEIKKAKNIAVVLHCSPDGDAIGSALALKEGLKSHEVTIVSSEDIPAIFETICGKVVVANKLGENFDLIILPDVSELHRTGFAGIISKSSLRNKVMIIDHHKTGDLAKNIKLVFRDNEAVSTTEMIDRVFSELRVEITPKVATALLLGVYTDTGGFQHKNTTSQALRLAGKLVNSGANLQLISSNLTSRLSTDQKRLWGRILEKITINRRGFATAVIREADLQQWGIEKKSLSGISNKLSLIREAKAVCVFVEEGDQYRATLRTRFENIDLKKLAKIFGGTGTKKAAGFTVTKDDFSSKIAE